MTVFKWFSTQGEYLHRPSVDKSSQCLLNIDNFEMHKYFIDNDCGNFIFISDDFMSVYYKAINGSYFKQSLLNYKFFKDKYKNFNIQDNDDDNILEN